MKQTRIITDPKVIDAICRQKSAVTRQDAIKSILDQNRWAGPYRGETPKAEPIGTYKGPKPEFVPL